MILTRHSVPSEPSATAAADRLVGGVEAAVEADLQERSRLVDGGERGVDRRQVERDRLLAERRQPGLGGERDQLGVRVGARADGHGVDVRQRVLQRRRHGHAVGARQPAGGRPGTASKTLASSAPPTREVSSSACICPMRPQPEQADPHHRLHASPLLSLGGRRARRGPRWIAGRSDVSGTPTSHHAPPSVHTWGSVSMTITVVRSVVRAQSNASSSSAIVSTLPRLAAQRCGVGDEVDARRRRLVRARRPQVVERLAALVHLEPLDHRVAAVVAHDDDHLVPRQHRRVEVAVEHQVRPVADEHDRVAVGRQIARGPSPRPSRRRARSPCTRTRTRSRTWRRRAIAIRCSARRGTRPTPSGRSRARRSPGR